jgi:two-component system, LytTR family, response regulator
MIRAYIVDDERLAVQRLSRMLRETGRVDVAGSATDPEDALAVLRAQPVDVLFLDIQMPGMTGFDLLEALERPPIVVFTTAYDVHALRAFETNAIDYLLKPIVPERLARALDKIERLARDDARTGSALQSDREAAPLPDIRALARQLAAELAGDRSSSGADKPAPLQRIASRVGERTTVLDVARITHFTAKDKLTFAIVNAREHVVDFTLAQLEERLDTRRFVRIHRSTIVNAAFVQELYPAVDGGVMVRLKDESKSELSVARDRVRELKSRLGI